MVERHVREQIDCTRLAGRSETATPGEVAQTWRWDVNAGLSLLATESFTAGGATESRSFLHDPGGSPLALLLPVGQGQAVHSYLRDWLGGVGGMIGPDGTLNGPMTKTRSAYPRGEDLVNGGQQLADDAPDNPFQFAGAYRETSQGERYQLRARNYDPGTGRFDSQDPLAPDAADPAIFHLRVRQQPADGADRPVWPAPRRRVRAGEGERQSGWGPSPSRTSLGISGQEVYTPRSEEAAS